MTFRLVPRAGRGGENSGANVVEISTEGEDSIGRGARSGVHDVVVSRCHIVVTSKPDSVVVRAAGMNPCEVARAGDEPGAPRKTLPKGEEIELKVGDSLFLVPGRYEFQLERRVPTVTIPASLTKRKAEESQSKGISSMMSTQALDEGVVFPPPMKPPEAKKQAKEEAQQATQPDDMFSQLRALFPVTDEKTIRGAIAKSKTLEEAASSLLAPEPEKKKEEEPATPIDRLAAVLPGTPRATLEAALSRAHGNVEAAASFVLEPPPPSPPPSPPSPPSSRSPYVSEESDWDPDTGTPYCKACLSSRRKRPAKFYVTLKKGTHIRCGCGHCWSDDFAPYYTCAYKCPSSIWPISGDRLEVEDECSGCGEPFFCEAKVDVTRVGADVHK